MKRSRFHEERVIGVLKEQEAGSAAADVCRRLYRRLGHRGFLRRRRRSC
jgi:hypothetical protein